MLQLLSTFPLQVIQLLSVTPSLIPLLFPAWHPPCQFRTFCIIRSPKVHKLHSHYINSEDLIDKLEWQRIWTQSKALVTLVTSFLWSEDSPDKTLRWAFILSYVFSRVMVDRASQVKRGFQDLLVKKAIVVQLAPQELGYQDLLDLVGFLEIKASMDYQGNKASLGVQVSPGIRWLWTWKTVPLQSIDMTQVHEET